MSARALAAIVAAAMVTTPIAATAATATSMVTASAVSGSAFVSRNGAIMPLRSGDALRAGDRVMTRAGSSVSIASQGCSRSLGASSMVMLAGTTCAVTSSSADLSQVGMDDDDDDGVAGVIPVSHYVVAFLAAVAVGLGIWAALDSETDDAPVSV